MSDGTYKRNEENDESPPLNLGLPEKQPRELGVHKMVFGAGITEGIGGVDINLKEGLAESITIVQDEYCNWEKKDDKKNECVQRRVMLACFLCLVFIGFEFAGGFLSNSLLIVADAAQLLTVFSTLMVSLFALKVSGRRPSQAEAVSWYRLEVMAALASVLVTWVLTSIVLFLAFERLVKGNFKIDVDMMLATSAFGVVANLVMGMSLHNYCHVKLPSGCEGNTEPQQVALNINVRSAFLHIVCDFLFSLAVFITALFIDCCPDWHIVDPISTFVFSLFVLFVTLAILRDLLGVLIDARGVLTVDSLKRLYVGMPKGVYFNDVLKTLLTIDGVQQVQNLRLWAISLDKIALAAHLIISPGVDHNEVLKIASRRVRAKYNFFEMTIHLEANPLLTIEDNQSTLPQKK